MKTLKKVPIDNTKAKKHYTKLKVKMIFRSVNIKMETNKKRKLLPKIMVCNVFNEEEYIIAEFD